MQDPHGELQGQNVLIVRYSLELTAAHFGISIEEVTELLASARAKMAEVRKSRPRPHLDTKMLASWNGKDIFWNSKMRHRLINILSDQNLSVFIMPPTYVFDVYHSFSPNLLL